MTVKLIKRRYLAFRVTSSFHLSKGEVLDVILQALSKVCEGSEPSGADVRIIEYDAWTGLGIVRCGHKSVDVLRSSMKVTHEISGGSVTMKVIGVSGTIKALRRKFLNI